VRRLAPQFAAAVLALATAAAGCGGEDSADEYREQASALCTESLREAESITPPRGQSGWDAFMRETLEIARSYTRELEQLEPPEELADLHEQVLRLNERAELLTERLRDDLAAGEPLRELIPPYLNDLISIGRRDNRLAREMGLPECVTPLPGPGDETPAPA
jgi:hypothetical protein